MELERNRFFVIVMRLHFFYSCKERPNVTFKIDLDRSFLLFNVSDIVIFTLYASTTLT